MMKEELNQWLSQNNFKKVVDVIKKQHPKDKQVVLIAAQISKYLNDCQGGLESVSDLKLAHNKIIDGLFQIVDKLYSSDAPETVSTLSETKLRAKEFKLKKHQQKIELYYQLIRDINCHTKLSNLSKQEKQDYTKSISSQISYLCFGTEEPPPFLDKPSMPPNTVVCCKVCRESDIKLEGNDQCPYCKVSTYAWM